MLKIAFHGGKCCGVKHIHGFGDPDDIEDAIVPIPIKGWIVDPDQCGHDVSSAMNMYNAKCPEETTTARLDRYIKYLDAVRPQGIIEAYLARDMDEDDPDDDQVTPWEPLLIERGFVLVNSCYNSNSGNRVFCYHRKTDKE